MDQTANNLLGAMVMQYRTAHRHQDPERIILTPQAALALALMQTYSGQFQGIEVEARQIDENEVAKPGEGTKLGVFLKGDPESLRCCDLL
jgi:hypothetical protein